MQRQASLDPAPAMALRDDEVHVWVIAPMVIDPGGARQLLDPSEQARAERFVRPADQQRFTAVHAVTRSLLGRYLSRSPSEVSYVVRCAVCGGPHGKPRVGAPADVGLEFSMSSSTEVALLAVARGAAVGVDIESTARNIDADDLLRFYAAGEQMALAGFAEHLIRQAAIETWTRKEAYSKALGVGLSLPLDSYEVTVPPDPPRVAVPAAQDVDGCEMVAIPLPEPYVATVAWTGFKRDVDLRVFEGTEAEL
jgi:4'-phosphopantetheinyl transferase